MLDLESDRISTIPSQMVYLGVLNQIGMVKVAGLSVDDLPRAYATCSPFNPILHGLFSGFFVLPHAFEDMR